MDLGVSRATPTPALVLALGQTGLDVAADVQAMLCRGDARRAIVTAFQALVVGLEGPAWVSVVDAQSFDPRGFGQLREAGQAVIDRSLALGADLEMTLRSLRTHERLIEAGLGSVSAPPIDILVLADVGEPFAAGALVPVTGLLQDALRRIPEGQGHLLLSAARPVPAGANGKADAVAYATLQELDLLLDPEREGAVRPLSEALRLERHALVALRTYVFDHLKEGTRAVRDGRELNVLLGNFLLALLSGALAQRLGEGAGLPDVLERRAFYSCGAATALIFEPGSLVEACAGRMGARFLAAEMGPAVRPDPLVAGERAAGMEGGWGNLRTWMERMTANTPCEIRVDEGELHLGLHFAGFRFGRIPKEDWAEAIRSHTVIFERNKLPLYRKTIEENAALLAGYVLSCQERDIEALPQAACLYPGGLQTSRLALRSLEDRLQDRIEALAGGGLTIPQRTGSRLDTLDDAAWNLPDLPAFAARLAVVCLMETYVLLTTIGEHYPVNVSRWLGPVAALLLCALTVGACVLWQWRKGRRLIALRQRCVRDSEQRFAALLEAGVRDQLLLLCQQLGASLERGEHDLVRLENTLRDVEGQLDALWAAHVRGDVLPDGAAGWPPGGGWHPLFRRTPVDGTIAEWVFGRWHRAPGDMRSSLLEKHGLLSDWRAVKAKLLLDRMLTYGRQVFAPVRAMTLDDVLRRRGSAEVEALSLSLAREAIPLLRADLDRLGGGSHVHAAQYVLAADPAASEVAAALQDGPLNWIAIATGDPYVVTCCRVRQMLPLASLRDITLRGRRAYEALEPDEQRDMHLYDEWLCRPGVD
jgi:hypothetical protein